MIRQPSAANLRTLNWTHRQAEIPCHPPHHLTAIPICDYSWGSGLTIRPNSVKLLGMKTLKRRLRRSKTETCATGWAICFEVLDGREREIIFQRFGLAGGKPKTLEAVGKKLGVTRERIRQIQNIALTKLRGRACRSAADG